MARRHLEDYTQDELNRLDYLDLLDLRADAFRRHVAEMKVPDPLAAWAALMAKRYGPLVKVWKNKLPWLDALMVVRYGEDPMKWPPAFTEADVDRAMAWASGHRVNTQRGSVPQGVTYLDDDGDRGFIRLRALGVLAAAWMVAHAAMVLGGLLGVFAIVASLAGRPDLALSCVLGSALSNFWENELIDHLFRSRSYTAPTAIHVALYTAAPGETGGGTEVTGGSYARVSYAPGFANWEGTNGETTDVDSAGTGGATQNRNAITFPAPTANWGSVTHFALLDASSGGNFYLYGALTAAKTVNNLDPAPSFPVGSLDVALA